MIKKSLAFIGAGRVSRFLLESWRRASALPERVLIVDPDDQVRRKTKSLFPTVIEVESDLREAAACGFIFLAVHPSDMAGVLTRLASLLTPAATVISLAPKWSLEKIQGELTGFKRLARIIPNVPSMVGRGFNPIVFGPDLDEADKRQLLDLFKPCGECLVVNEKKLAAYALVAAMGPTCLWFQLQELISIGEECGLTPREAHLAVLRMTGGAAAVLEDAGWPEEELVDLVPLKPLAGDEQSIRKILRERLLPVWEKIRES